MRKITKQEYDELAAMVYAELPPYCDGIHSIDIIPPSGWCRLTGGIYYTWESELGPMPISPFGDPIHDSRFAWVNFAAYEKGVEVDNDFDADELRKYILLQ